MTDSIPDSIRTAQTPGEVGFPGGGASAAAPLDALSLPLQGSRLIEASAGTGKTWTIASLYLRLVLGHGPAGALRPLLPGEILVMTFTKAATRELSRRIRERLVEAARCLRAEPGAKPDDDFLRGLVAHYAEAGGAARAAWLLTRAAEAMDDAAIHTIDAWCQRMLREHAFDSGCLFDEELQANEAAMFTEAVHDYWRQQVYPLEGEVLAQVLALWPDAARLHEAMLELHEKPLPPAAGQGDLGECVARQRAQRRAELAALKAGWVERAAQMRAWLRALWTRMDKPIDGHVLGQANGKRWLDSLDAWAADPEAERPHKLGEGERKLTYRGVMSALKPGFESLQPPEGFARFDVLMQALANRPEPAAALRAVILPHAAARVAQRMQQLKQQSGTYGFADMLARLDHALDEAQQGPSAARLRHRILAQYPAALIDEFQDTSPVQLSIFERIYRIAGNAPGRVLLLIGDPKQAIYGFRGADIRSYLRARRATAGRHHVLATNHRATGPLVTAVNECFRRAEARPGEGAFMFGAAGDTELPFVPVQAQGRDERFVTATGAPPPLMMCLDAVPRSRPDSRELFAALGAERVVELLNDPHAGFETAGGDMRRLRPADVAVLVRTGREAEVMRRALRQRGVASVYLSDKETVFAQPEAGDLLRLLQAVAAPRDMRLARAAFATALAGASLPELAHLADDEEAFDARCALLREWHATWQTQGVLAMLRRALHGLRLPARWLAPAAGGGNDGDGGGEGAETGRLEGERRLTNLLHLAELLQAQSTRLHGEQALIRWLSQQVDDAVAGRGATTLGGGSEEQVLRLESDADLVQVVTVHQSKGLEYPLVFLPFAADFRGVGKQDGFVQLPGEAGRELEFTPSAEQRQQADRERLREDLRLLYVALTRARHALWLGVAALAENGKPLWRRSALGYLISGPEGQAGAGQRADLEALARAVPTISIEEPAWAGPPGEEDAGAHTPTVPRTRLLERAPPALLGPPREYDAQFDCAWSISSYSALVRGLKEVRGKEGVGATAAWSSSATGDAPAGARLTTASDDAAPEELGQRLLLDDEPSEVGEAAPSTEVRAVAPSAEPWHRFPRGAFAGHFLHTQLEWLAEEGLIAALDTSPAAQQALRRRCERQGWGHRADDVLAWLRRVCSTPLPALGRPGEGDGDGGTDIAAATPAPITPRSASGGGVALAGLERTLPEMEFWLPSDGWDVRAIDDLCRAHILPGQPRPALAERTLHGLLMGFADLVFEHEGRFGVLDYKSNALGAHDADYTRAAMEAALLQHRYDVQAALYLLALHRLLEQRRRAGYEPERHLHGAVFFFMRGVAGTGAGGLLVRPPLALLRALDVRAAGVAGVAPVAHAEPIAAALAEKPA